MRTNWLRFPAPFFPSGIEWGRKAVVCLNLLLTAGEALALVLALSLDAFAASFAYGADRVRIPPASLAVISGVCSGVLGLSLLLGSGAAPWLPAGIPSLIGFLLLLIIGCVRLFDRSIKALIRSRRLTEKRIQFHLFSLCVILDIYACPQNADRDQSRVLSPGEAASLAMALSLDGLAAGFGAGLSQVDWLLPVLFSLIVGAAAVRLGDLAGQRLAKRIPFDLSWLSGLLLILLALLKVIV